MSAAIDQVAEGRPEPSLEKTQATEVEAPKTPFALRRLLYQIARTKRVKMEFMENYFADGDR